MSNKKQYLSYGDVFLIPNYSELKTRADADTSIQMGRFKLKIPVMPANMATTISFETAKWLAQNGYFYILHRFYSYTDVEYWLKSYTMDTGSLPFISLSLGIKERDYDLIHKIAREDYRLDYVTVDVAHGDHAEVYKMLEFLNDYKKNCNPNLFIIGGNVATSDAFNRMAKYCDAVKVGIAYGKSCITYNKTGFASPMFSAIRDVKENAYPVTRVNSDLKSIPMIIADGGISCNGDISKALVAGADMVMCGSMFAACVDSPAPFHPTDSGYKIYFGSASKMNGNTKNIEGTAISIKTNGMTYEQKMTEIKQDLSSAISYSGGVDLKAFKSVEYGTV